MLSKAVYRNVRIGALPVDKFGDFATGIRRELHARCPLRRDGREQSVEVTFDRKAVGAVEVDVPEGDRSDVRQDFIGRNRPTAFFSRLEYLMKLPSVVVMTALVNNVRAPEIIARSSRR